MIHLEVAVAAPLDQTLTYSFQEKDNQDEYGTSNKNYVGRRVLVPLGKRRVTGYVVQQVILAEEVNFEVRKINCFQDEYPLFHENSVSFYRWLAHYYHYPLGLVIKSALPGGLTPKSAKKIILQAVDDLFLSVFDQNIPDWAYKLVKQKKLSVVESSRLLSSKQDKAMVTNLLGSGLLKIESFMAKDGVREKNELCYGFTSPSRFFLKMNGGSPEEIKEYRREFVESDGIDLKVSEIKALYSLQKLTLDTNRATIALKDLRQNYGGASKALQSLEEKKLVFCQKERVFRSPFGKQLKHYPRPDHLTAEQQVVLDTLSNAIKAEKFSPFLLHGVTGSGKTEVYLRAAEQTLALGRDVIIMVPEIALATQLEAHLLSRFGDLVVLLHSALTAAERYDQFYLALTGKAKVVIGARSAIFAPFRDPGLIVVDEEHDGSFKQDDNFRYHGRDIAVLRARHHDAVVILGSATPSITSYANTQKGKYTLLTLNERVGMSSLPHVSIVDLNKKREKETVGIIKKQLQEKLEKNLTKGRQSILLLNRRGFSAVVLCRDCGTPVQCNHCHVSLTLHKGRNQLVCHYCGFKVSNKLTCLQCRSDDLIPAGFGTERVEEEIRELFPDARVKRLDSDTAANRKKFLNILSEMHDGHIDILIGTQMIAKGHHFPNVTLVGVVWADGGMCMPDFRAAERTFQLLTQVIGRAGRGDLPGEVIIQTMRPEHYAIVFSRDHQYGKMFEREMELRKHPAFPPYLRLTVLRLQGRVEKYVQQSAVRIARFCREASKKEQFSIETLGPAPAPLDKIKDNYRWQILLKGWDTEQLNGLCKAVKAKTRELVGNQCTLIIDVDPENMM